MAKTTKEMQEYYKSRVRSALVVDPQASLRSIQLALEKSKSPLKLSLGFLSGIVKKINKERTYRNNNANIKTRLALLQDKIKRIDMELWGVASGHATADKDKIQALKALAENDIKLLNAEMDAGIFERQVGTIKVDERKINFVQIINKINPNDRERLINAIKESLPDRSGGERASIQAGLDLPDRTRDLPAPQEISGTQLETGEITPRVE